MKKSTIIFVIYTLVASAASYVTYPILVRVLPPTEYVNVTVSLSILTQISTFLISIVAITIGLSKEDNGRHAHVIIPKLQTILLRTFLIISALVLLSSPFLLPIINTPVIYMFPIVMMVIISIPLNIISGYLNGKNLIIKLGQALLIANGSQLIIGVIFAALTKNGVITIFGMALSQIAAIVIIRSLFKKDDLPKMAVTINKRVALDNTVKKIARYAIASSFAIMLISLAQIADLLIVKANSLTDARFYTNIYILSRVVFFGGTIFIWPFLAKIDFHNTVNNISGYYKLLGLFVGITLFSILAILLFGTNITNTLFGGLNGANEFRQVAVLSTTYQLLFLIITASCLYLTVLRSRLLFSISFITSGIILLYALCIRYTGITTTLTAIDTIAAVIALLCIILVQKKSNVNYVYWK